MSKTGIGREKMYLVVIVILILVLAGFYLQSFLMTGSQVQAVDKVKGVYELISEADVEVLSVEEISGMYKVLLRTKGITGDTLQEVYVTKDGSLTTDKIIITDDYKTRLENEKAFAECLKEKGLLIFGQSNEINTIQQLQLLGSFSYKVYVDCLGANVEVCQQIGIQEIPTVAYDDKAYTGTKTAEWFETLTGCEM